MGASRTSFGSTRNDTSHPDQHSRNTQRPHSRVASTLLGLIHAGALGLCGFACQAPPENRGRMDRLSGNMPFRDWFRRNPYITSGSTKKPPIRKNSRMNVASFSCFLHELADPVAIDTERRRKEEEERDSGNDCRERELSRSKCRKPDMIVAILKGIGSAPRDQDPEPRFMRAFSEVQSALSPRP